MSLKTKLIVLFISVVMIPLMYVGVVSYVTAYDALEVQALSALSDIAALKESNIFLYFENLKTRMRDFASDGFISGKLSDIEKGIDVAENARLLNRHIVVNKQVLDPRILSLSVIDLAGTIVSSTNGEEVGHSVEDIALFNAGLKETVLGSSRKTDDDIVTLYAITPIFSSDGRRTTEGALSALFDVTELSEVISGSLILHYGALSQTIHSGKTLDMYVADSDGRIIFKSQGDPARISGNLKDVPPVQACLLHGQEYIGNWKDHRGIEVLGASMCIMLNNDRWVIFSQQDVSEVLDYPRHYGRLVLIVGAIILLIVIVTAVPIAQRISQPIEKLRYGTAMIANGDFDHRVAIQGSDEIARLSQDFDAMSERLRKTMASRDQLERTERELRSQSMFPVVNPNIVAKLDEAGHVIYLNEYGRAFLEENELKSPKEVLPSNSNQLVEEVLDENRVLKNVELTCKGHRFDFEYSPFREERTVYVYGRDVTELKQKEEELERANRMKSEFLANMSHELRTPLNSIIGFSEVLYDETFAPLNEKQKDYLNDVLSAARHLLSLINDILDLSKIEAGKEDLKLSSMPLSDLVEDSIVLVKEKAYKHRIDIKVDIDESIGSLDVDERKIKQIFYNLLSNALKFTPDGGEIGIRAVRGDDDVRIDVWDTGVGIAQDDQDRIFGEFIQLEDPFTKKAQGTGLGLALTRKLVELHGGIITVSSEGSGKGTTFTFTLPIEGGRNRDESRTDNIDH